MGDSFMEKALANPKVAEWLLSPSVPTNLNTEASENSIILQYSFNAQRQSAIIPNDTNYTKSRREAAIIKNIIQLVQCFGDFGVGTARNAGYEGLNTKILDSMTSDATTRKVAVYLPSLYCQILEAQHYPALSTVLVSTFTFKQPSYVDHKFKYFELAKSNDGLREVDIIKGSLSGMFETMESERPINTLINHSEETWLSHYCRLHIGKFKSLTLSIVKAENDSVEREKYFLDASIFVSSNPQLFMEMMFSGAAAHTDQKAVWSIGVDETYLDYPNELYAMTLLGKCPLKKKAIKPIPRSMPTESLNVEKAEITVEPVATKKLKMFHIPMPMSTGKRCQECGGLFEHDIDLAGHYLFKHIKYKELNNATIKRFLCPKCDSTFKRNNDLQRHIKAVHERRKNYKCNYCGTCFAQTWHLNAHIKAIHGKKKSFRCEECDIGFLKEVDVRKHNETAHQKLETPESRVNSVEESQMNID